MANSPVWNADNTKNNTATHIADMNEINENGIYAATGQVVTDFTSIYNASVSNKTGKSTHKSLDFSNVGIPTNQNENAYANFRQFHQTRLYINNFSGMRQHGMMYDKGKENTYIISANLPETIGYSIGSTWETPIPKLGGSLFNMLMQLGSSKVLNGENLSNFNRANTLKIWGGSDALSLSLLIPVIDDGYATDENQTGIRTNLVEALEFLGALCLPSEDGTLGFYTPPPSPLNLNIKYNRLWGEKRGEENTVTLAPTNARIMLQLGGILLVDNCIIKGISVNYPNTKVMIRHHYNIGQIGGGGTDYLTPLLATVKIDITTVEAMTSNYFSKMLWLRPNDMGTGTSDIAAVDNKLADMVS